MAENIIKLIAHFVNADTGKPLSESTLRVRFMDRDAIKDDLLGETALTADGRAEVLTTTSSYRSGLMGLLGSALAESKPDIYCEVREGDKPVYRSAVAWNVNPEEVDPVTKSTTRTIDVGTFKFRGEGLEDIEPSGESAMKGAF